MQHNLISYLFQSLLFKNLTFQIDNLNKYWSNAAMQKWFSKHHCMERIKQKWKIAIFVHCKYVENICMTYSEHLSFYMHVRWFIRHDNNPAVSCCFVCGQICRLIFACCFWRARSTSMSVRANLYWTSVILTHVCVSYSYLMLSCKTRRAFYKHLLTSTS